jgi:CubicO group peptidase (beta-lactamase class C family)
MTVRMTLSHMSGLPFFPGMPIDKRSIAELAHLAATTPLAADPGERYAYSNWGIDVAMAVVEKVAGRSFAAVMKERILDPLGMKDATFVPSEEQMTRLAKSYRLSDNLKPREIKIAQFRYPYTDPTREPEGGGGLFGTADDLCRFFRMLAAGGTAPDGRRILSEQAVREMTRRQTPDRPKITSYGFGLNVKPNFVGHGGAYGT